MKNLLFYNMHTRKADQSTWNSPKYVNSYSNIAVHRRAQDPKTQATLECKSKWARARGLGTVYPLFLTHKEGQTNQCRNPAVNNNYPIYICHQFLEKKNI